VAEREQQQQQRQASRLRWERELAGQALSQLQRQALSLPGEQLNRHTHAPTRQLTETPAPPRHHWRRCSGVRLPSLEAALDAPSPRQALMALLLEALAPLSPDPRPHEGQEEEGEGEQAPHEAGHPAVDAPSPTAADILRGLRPEGPGGGGGGAVTPERRGDPAAVASTTSDGHDAARMRSARERGRPELRPLLSEKPVQSINVSCGYLLLCAAWSAALLMRWSCLVATACSGAHRGGGGGSRAGVCGIDGGGSCVSTGISATAHAAGRRPAGAAAARVQPAGGGAQPITADNSR
jgi:hypothetical protein